MQPASVVVDTSVFVASAFRPDSDSAALIEAIRRGRLRLIWDDPTRRETERILRKIPPVSWEDVVELFRPAGRHPHDVDPASHSSVPDPEDRKFAALASSARVPLVSLDRHLFVGGDEGEFLCFRPGEFLLRAGLRRTHGRGGMKTSP